MLQYTAKQTEQPDLKSILVESHDSLFLLLQEKPKIPKPLPPNAKHVAKVTYVTSYMILFSLFLISDTKVSIKVQALTLLCSENTGVSLDKMLRVYVNLYV